MASVRLQRQPATVVDPPIEREEIVALLFNVSDLVDEVTKIRELLEDDDGKEEED